MQYFGCKTEKDYKNKAEACLKGIDKIKDDISKTKSKKKRAELALAYAPDIAVLEKTYRMCRSAYDVLFSGFLSSLKYS